MLPSHHIYSGSLSDDTDDSISLPLDNSFGVDLQHLRSLNTQHSNSGTANHEPPNADHFEQILRYIHQSRSYSDSDSDTTGSANISKNEQDHFEDQIADANIKNDHQLESSLNHSSVSDSPILATLNEEEQLHPLEEVPNDTRNKRQKLRQSQSFQNHLLKNDVYPISSKAWSPQSMATPPTSTTERSFTAKPFDKIKAHELQAIPPFRRKEPLKDAQAKENHIQLNDKKNVPISNNNLNVAFHQQFNRTDNNNRQHDNQHPVKHVLRQTATNNSNNRNMHPRHIHKRLTYRDSNDDKRHINNNGKEVVRPLSSVDINRSDRRHSYVKSLHVERYDLDQKKNAKTPAFSDKEHKQQEEDGELPKSHGSTKHKKVLTGELRLNGDAYTILNMIGHGGSGAVYRVLHHKSKEIQALKHVVTIHLSRQTTRDYRNEINFLYQLRKKRCAHIPLLYNYKYCRSSGDLSIVLELGEIDFASYLGMQKSKPLNMNFVRWYGQQMLEAIAEIHDENVVHRDLKPANFILKEGSLKLIDFGISKKVDRYTGTVNIDTPTGTINYMPPEAFAFVGDGPEKHTQIGLPSDIWALGCILYQMIYGRTPFHRIPQDQKAQHICATSTKIDYPSVVHFNPTNSKQGGGSDEDTYSTQKTSHISIGKDTVAILQSCLDRNPLLRLSAKELLEHRFFHPSSSTL